VTAAQAAEVLALSYLVILPFTLQFDSMVDGVALAQNHSLPHQLLVLWGLPALLTVLFLLSLLWEKLHGMEHKSLYRLMEAVNIPDLFAVIMGLCALGLVLIPELVYVRDIYENGNARANTMFKLTYQAYMLFGMTMGYVIYRMMLISRQKLVKFLSCVGLVLLICTGGYFGNSVKSWFGNVWDTSAYQGLDATAFLITDFPEDVEAIRWLKANIEGSPVVLEANGDSYTGYERVSAMTGLPTILGWYVHEWLWRNDVADLNEKSSHVETIYTSKEEAQVKALLGEYEVSYIFVGSKEREKYGENLNEELLKSLGEIVFQDVNYETYIIKVS
jgi:YYY domain-containing protein